jgi:hypothetical protein
VIRRMSLIVRSLSDIHFFFLSSYFQSNKTLQLYRGHTGPVTAMTICPSSPEYMLITGSWDKVHVSIGDVITATNRYARQLKSGTQRYAIEMEMVLMRLDNIVY